MHVKKGDTVIVRRAGDVIPEIVGPVPAKRPKGARPWKMPKKCPSCGTELVRPEHVARVVGHRRVQAHEVARGEEGVERHGLRPGALDVGRREVGVVHEDLRPEADEPASDRAPDGAEADEADHLPPELAAL